jgi:ABC-2 type transport system permease protein
MADGHMALPPPTNRTIGEALADSATQVWAVAAAEVQKLYHDPLELVTRAVQPVLWCFCSAR